MITFLQEYFTRLIFAVFLIAAVQAITIRGLTGKISKLACGLILLLVVLRPLTEIDLENWSEALTKAHVESMDFGAYEKQNQEALSEIIIEKTKAYILDKAANLSFSPKDVTVELRAGEEYPYPCHVTITGMYTQMQRMELTSWIEINLAISEKNQTWRWE